MSNALDWAVRSDVECERFSLQVYRSRPDFQLPTRGSCEEALLSANVDVLVARVAAGEKQIPQALASTHYEVRYADSLVHYSIALQSREHPPRGRSSGEVIVRRAEATDATGAAAISRSAFADYPSHYAASTDLFPRESVAAGYGQWAENHIRGQGDRAPAFVATRESRLIGFLTCTVEESRNTMEVLLNAVDSEERRRGVYSMMLNSAMEYAEHMGCRELRVSTQLANIPVQRAWCKLGLRIYRALDTYHVRRKGPDRRNEGRR